MVIFASIGYGDIIPDNRQRLVLAVLVLVGVGVAANLIGIFGAVMDSKEEASQYALLRVLVAITDEIKKYLDILTSFVAHHNGDEVRMTEAELRDAMKHIDNAVAMRNATKQLFFREIFVRFIITRFHLMRLVICCDCDELEAEAQCPHRWRSALRDDIDRRLQHDGGNVCIHSLY